VPKDSSKDIFMSSITIKETYVQDLHQNKKGFSGLRAPSLLAKWPIIGLTMLIFGSLVFGALTYNLFADGPLLAWDKAIANTLPAIGLKSPPIVKIIMDTGFYIGGLVLVILGVLLGIYFIYKQFWQGLVMVTTGLGGSGLLFYSLSNLIARRRPTDQIWIIEKIPGFPSGHAITVVVFYGLLAYWIVPKVPSVFWKVVVAAAAIFIMGFVGFTRIFTGGHYLTDVLAGYAVGIAWFGVVFTLIELFYQKRRSRNVK
jgi:membrane-associated phospholipid phosphatase